MLQEHNYSSNVITIILSIIFQYLRLDNYLASSGIPIVTAELVCRPIIHMIKPACSVSNV